MQRQEFVELFSRMLRARLNEALAGGRENRTVSYVVGASSRDREPGVVRVSMTVTADGSDLHVIYYLVRAADGWRMIDYAIEGVLLSRNYRGQFNFLMRKYGYAGMIDRMREKAGDVDHTT
jgi:ABC-type transporter MlaC component